MFGKIFGSSAPADTPQEIRISIRLNARLQPVQRGEYFEDPLDHALRSEDLGEVVGGGTVLADDPDGMIACDIEMALHKDIDDTVGRIVAFLDQAGAPAGSALMRPGHEPVSFGLWQGMAVFLNGTDLPDAVYAGADINETIDGLVQALSGLGELRGHWQGGLGTSLYFYGPEFADMSAAAAAYAATDPLCGQCQITQIA
ncbi:MAG: hypothetical protein Q4G25_08245 [Paracoccus sp. (in: a-proteobacteria)]|nr:hypothetical protein [Paracoccus sp. (in: a-proteobacteria)]